MLARPAGLPTLDGNIGLGFKSGCLRHGEDPHG
jgi:hypothetical protein